MGMLQGKVAIITGASSRIGRAAAMLFGAEGRGRPALEDVADAIRGKGEECVS
jgi:NAD(P)-dependent dehydrogenase (short-subunit alcohol dehydrogenase family)